MLRLKIGVERADRKKREEIVAIANSGFVGAKPQLLIPKELAKMLRLNEISEPTIINKKTADGRTISFIAYPNSAYVKLVVEDKESPEILVDRSCLLFS